MNFRVPFTEYNLVLYVANGYNRTAHGQISLKQLLKVATQMCQIALNTKYKQIHQVERKSLLKKSWEIVEERG